MIDLPPQNQNVAEITDSVLKEKRYGYPFELRLAGPAFDGVYPKRDYVRQMWESDFEFLRRLWCEWGLYFFMEGSTLVLCDSPGAHKRHGEAYETIRYYAPDGKQIDEEHIFRLDVSRELTAGAVSLIDYDYTRSRANLGVVERDEGDASLANAEHYGWGDYSQPLAGGSLAAPASQSATPTPAAQTVTVQVANTNLTVTVTVTRTTATVRQTATMPQAAMPAWNPVTFTQNAWQATHALARGDLALVVGTRSHWTLHARLVLFTPLSTATVGGMAAAGTGATPVATPTAAATHW